MNWSYIQEVLPLFGKATLVDTYGLDYEDSLVLEGGGQAK